MGTPQQPPGQTTIAGTLLSYLTSITTWSRAGIAIVLGLVSLFGVLIYQNPQTCFELIQGFVSRRNECAAEPYMTPLTTDVQREMTTLLPQLAPHIVGVTAWRASLSSNQAQLVAAAMLPNFQGTYEQLYQERWRYPVALFGDDPNVDFALGRIYVGRFHCTTEISGWRATRRFPMKQVCLVAIPPDGYGLGGAIVAAWDEEIPWDQMASVESIMREVATRMTWWPKKRAGSTQQGDNEGSLGAWAFAAGAGSPDAAILTSTTTESTTTTTLTTE